MASLSGPESDGKGEYWRLRWYPEPGEPQREWRARSLEEGERWLRKINDAIEDGDPPPEPHRRRRRRSPTLEDVFEMYKERHWSDLDEDSRVNYEGVWLTHVCDENYGIAHISVRRLERDPGRIQKFRVDLLDKKKAGRTNVNRTLVFLRQMLNKAKHIADSGVTKNPFDSGAVTVERPKRSKAVKNYTPDGIETVRACIWLVPSGVTTRWRDIGDTVLGTGVWMGGRPGELRPLRKRHMGDRTWVIEDSVSKPDPDEDRVKRDSRIELVTMPDGKVAQIGLTKTEEPRYPTLYVPARLQVEAFLGRWPDDPEGFFWRELLTPAGWRYLIRHVINPARVLAAQLMPHEAGLSKAQVKNLTRHSHAAHRLRCGAVNNLSALAGELGNTVRVLEEDYLRVLIDVRHDTYEPLDFESTLIAAHERARILVARPETVNALIGAQTSRILPDRPASPFSD